MLVVPRSTDSVARIGYACASVCRVLASGLSFTACARACALGVGEQRWAGVVIEFRVLQSRSAAVRSTLSDYAPRLARVESVERTSIAPSAATDFAIVERKTPQSRTAVPADAAVCEECLAELFEPHDRRYRYAFINCTQCGPRYTITRALPYDRAQTSMSGFAQCPACLAEYTSPEHRRFHAEPNACPACGPRLALVDAAGQAVAGDPIEATLARLLAGEIVAIKGLGGFHLACTPATLALSHACAAASTVKKSHSR